MEKRLKIVLISMGILFGGIFLWKAFTGFMFKRYMASHVPTSVVSAMQVGYSPWQKKLTAAASVIAINGVDVTTSISGMVDAILFTSGSEVKADDVLVRLNADAEIGQLQALEASAELARITLKRDKAQYAIQAVSKQTLQTDEQNVKNFEGQVAQQAAIVAKKTIRAPFSGRLGIQMLNLGQFLNPGDKIVSLQTLDPIYVDFYIPQQSLPDVRVNQAVVVTTTAYPNKRFIGKITSIDSAVDTTTRNIKIRALVSNPKGELTPGMFANIEASVGTPHLYLTLPQTAVAFNPYGEILYILHEKENTKKKKDEPIVYVAKQSFVTTGETRGDQIAILKGLKKGDLVVTSGQLKLKNGSLVTINNTLVPANNPAPHLSDEH